MSEQILQCSLACKSLSNVKKLLAFKILNEEVCTWFRWGKTKVPVNIVHHDASTLT